MAVLALPPVLPAVQRQLHLSEGLVGALTSLPVLMLALGSVVGSAAVGRLGARRALVTGLVVVGVASALRGLGGLEGLLLASVAVGLGIAILQPSMPSVTQAWFPGRVGLATSVYSNGIVFGEAAAASLTLPLVLPLTGSWRITLALWGVPALAAAVLVGTCVRPAAPAGAGVAAASGPPPQRRWWPSWSHGVTWRVGLLQGGGSVVYFGTNAFVPTELHAVGHPGLVAPCLAALNTSQLVASVVVAVLAHRGGRPHWVLTVCAVGAVAGLGGLVALPATLGVAGCGLVGVCSAIAFVVALALPPLLASPDEVHRMAGATSTIGYVAAFVLPFCGGILWDTTGRPATAFIPAALGAALFGSVLWWPGRSARSLAGLCIR
jgi:CP family cyanate transporter-like MFS transporter